MTLENNSHKPQDVSLGLVVIGGFTTRGTVKFSDNILLIHEDFRAGHRRRIKCDILCTVVIIIATAVTGNDGVIDGMLKNASYLPQMGFCGTCSRKKKMSLLYTEKT